MSVSAQVLTSFFSFNAFFWKRTTYFIKKTGLICVNDLSCPLHFMFCLHEQTSKLSVHIWQITRQLWVWLHVPNSHRTKTLGSFRIEFRNLFGRMCGSRIKKTCLSRKKKKKKNGQFFYEWFRRIQALSMPKKILKAYLVWFVCLFACFLNKNTFLQTFSVPGNASIDNQNINHIVRLHVTNCCSIVGSSKHWRD